MFERFTERARQVVVLAQDEARALKHNYIGTEHILLGLLREEEGLAARVLESLDIMLDVYPDQEHPNVVESKRALMELYAAWNRPDQVERYRVPPGQFIAY